MSIIYTDELNCIAESIEGLTIENARKWNKRGQIALIWKEQGQGCKAKREKTKERQKQTSPTAKFCRRKNRVEECLRLLRRISTEIELLMNSRGKDANRNWYQEPHTAATQWIKTNNGFLRHEGRETMAWTSGSLWNPKLTLRQSFSILGEHGSSKAHHNCQKHGVTQGNRIRTLEWRNWGKSSYAF